VIVFLVIAACIILLFVSVFDTRSRLQRLKSVQEASANRPETALRRIAKIENEIGRIKQRQKEKGQAAEKELEELRLFKADAEKELERLQKENKVMLLNNRDFIKMFEQIQNDLDETRLIMTPVSYKTGGEDRKQEVK
jgi:hypothetical protein